MDIIQVSPQPYHNCISDYSYSSVLVVGTTPNGYITCIKHRQPKRSDNKIPSVSKTKKDHRSECSTCLSADWFTSSTTSYSGTMTKLMLGGPQTRNDRCYSFMNRRQHTRATYVLLPGDRTPLGYVTTLHDRGSGPFTANAV